MLSRTVNSTRILNRNLWSQRRVSTIVNRRPSLFCSTTNVNLFLLGQSIAPGRSDIRSYTFWVNFWNWENHKNPKNEDNLKKDEHPKNLTIPEKWPQVPVIAQARSPVFPGFFKKIEVTDSRLVKILRSKVQMSQPYIGVFLKRDAKCKKEVVPTLQELYSVGTFCEIMEFQDLGDKLQMTVKAHRRIRLLGQVVQGERFTKREGKELMEKYARTFDEVVLSGFTDAPCVVGGSSDAPLSLSHVPVLIAETENFKLTPFNMEKTMVALRNEIFKRIEALYQVNPLYEDKARSMIMRDAWSINDLEQICDLGAAISASENHHFKCGLQEMNFTTRMMMTLALLENEIKVNKRRQEEFNCDCDMKMINKELGIETGEKETIEEMLRARLKDKVHDQPVQAASEEERENISTASQAWKKLLKDAPELNTKMLQPKLEREMKEKGRLERWSNMYTRTPNDSNEMRLEQLKQ